MVSCLLPSPARPSHIPWVPQHWVSRDPHLAEHTISCRLSPLPTALSCDSSEICLSPGRWCRQSLWGRNEQRQAQHTACFPVSLSTFLFTFGEPKPPRAGDTHTYARPDPSTPGAVTGGTHTQQGRDPFSPAGHTTSPQSDCVHISRSLCLPWNHIRAPPAQTQDQDDLKILPEARPKRKTSVCPLMGSSLTLR